MTFFIDINPTEARYITDPRPSIPLSNKGIPLMSKNDLIPLIKSDTYLNGLMQQILTIKIIDITNGTKLIHDTKIFTLETLH